MGQNCASVQKTAVTKPGLLDGSSVLRFAHAFETGGGTERYLDDLDRALLERNAMTIVRLHLTRNSPAGQPVGEKVGQGMLVRVPLPILPDRGSPSGDEEHSLRARLKQLARDWILYNPTVWHLAGAKWTAALKLPSLSGQAVAAGSVTSSMLREYRCNLVMLHFFGGADADDVIDQARKAAVPIGLLNHFANDRFRHLAIRKHVMASDGVAGVNGLDLPGFLRGQFTNLSDGIDTVFFNRANARPVEGLPAMPIVLLPARVIREKGQLDLVRAAAALHRSGIKCCLAFAGRVDSSGFVDELRTTIDRAGLTANVRFLGILNLEQLRDWYAASAVVALPTYHHEGLPRVIIEAQAMGTPVVAYAMGGMAEGIESGRTGYLLRPGDIAGLTSRLRELLSSPALQSSMGISGRESAESRFSLAALADRHEHFYRRLIAEYQKPTGTSVVG